jgi:hypothetical protein
VRGAENLARRNATIIQYVRITNTAIATPIIPGGV